MELPTGSSTQSSITQMKIEFETHPSLQDIELLTNQINFEAAATGILSIASPFAFFVRDQQRNIIAGCNGSIIYGTIYTDQLWVNTQFRGQGMGQSLMDKVHILGIENGCTMATACTMNFQDAKPFYEKLGYVCDFERQGYTQGTSCCFMKKELNTV